MKPINLYRFPIVLAFCCGAMILQARPPQDGSMWETMPTFTDWFSTFDTTKWHDTNPKWKGRQPGFFSPDNVAVKQGKLTLTARCEEPPTDALRKAGYHTFSTAAVTHKQLAFYGYYEVRAKAMKSRASSAFWFHRDDKKDCTEIDVFEICGGTPKEAKVDYMTLHVSRRDGTKVQEKVAKTYISPTPLTDNYHRYGVDWASDKITFYFDGKAVNSVPNTNWHQSLHLLFDSETMPDWFGLPKASELPSTFSIDYIRAWRRVAKPTFSGDFAGLESWKKNMGETGVTLKQFTLSKDATGEHPAKLDMPYITITTRANTKDRVKIESEERFGYGTYTWKIFVPAMGVGDQASIGAFIYQDDRHEIDFEIGYGTAKARKETNAKPDELLAYCTSQANPFLSKAYPIKRDRTYLLTIRMMPALNDKTFITWEIDGQQVQSLNANFTCRPDSFRAICSVENLGFLGDHVPKQDNYASFSKMTYAPFVGATPTANPVTSAQKK